jgi:hypothetical protein
LSACMISVSIIKTTMERRKQMGKTGVKVNVEVGVLIGAGQSYADIASELKVCEGTVRKWHKGNRSVHPLIANAVKQLAARSVTVSDALWEELGMPRPAPEPAAPVPDAPLARASEAAAAESDPETGSEASRESAVPKFRGRGRPPRRGSRGRGGRRGRGRGSR